MLRRWQKMESTIRQKYGIRNMIMPSLLTQEVNVFSTHTTTLRNSIKTLPVGKLTSLLSILHRQILAQCITRRESYFVLPEVRVEQSSMYMVGISQLF